MIKDIGLSPTLWLWPDSNFVAEGFKDNSQQPDGWRAEAGLNTLYCLLLHADRLCELRLCDALSLAYLSELHSYAELCIVPECF